MSTYRSLATAAGLAALGTALFLSSRAGGDRIRLGMDELSQSRGCNNHLVLVQSPCWLFSGLTACEEPFSTCYTCDRETYTNVTLGFDGGYTAGTGVASCGVRWFGICQTDYTCLKFAQDDVQCSSPPNVVVQ